MNRREFSMLSFACIPGFTMLSGCITHTSNVDATKLMSKSFVNGVQFGVQPFCYHDLVMNIANRKSLIEKVRTNGFGLMELHARWCEPKFNDPGVSKEEAREKVRQWRINTPDSYYQDIRKEFDEAGISILNYYVDMDASYFNNYTEYSDEEVDATFRAAKILGAGACVGSEGQKAIKRLVPFAEKHNMFVSVHNHSNLSDPDAFNNEESFVKAFAFSPNVRATFDTRHYTAANGDCIAFLKKHHALVRNIHLGNRKRNQGRSARFGEGDTPLAEILKLIRDNNWQIPVIIEFEHGTRNTSVTEVQRTYQYCKNALLG
jgi:hypothetical protein